jgi:hypothetical protein
MDELNTILRSPVFWILQFLTLIVGVLGNITYASLDRRYGIWSAHRRKETELQKAEWERRVEELACDPERFEREDQNLRYMYIRVMLQVIISILAIMTFFILTAIVLVLVTGGLLSSTLALVAIWFVFIGTAVSTRKLIINAFRLGGRFMRNSSAWMEARDRMKSRGTTE